LGIIIEKARFKTPAPRLQQIVDTITEISGLPIIVEEASPEIKGNFHDFCAHLAFESDPKNRLEIKAYIPGIVQKNYQQMREGEMGEFAPKAQGWDETPEFQTVHLQSYLGAEPTLIVVATLALEKLGGELKRPISDDERREFGVRLTPEILNERRKKIRRQMLFPGILFLIFLPVTLVITLLTSTITMPYRIWKAYRTLKEKGFIKKP
jgi:hypothetical protein